MKIVLTRADVERMVLDQLMTQFPLVNLNTVEIADRWSTDFCTVTYEKPEEPAKVEA